MRIELTVDDNEIEQFVSALGRALAEDLRSSGNWANETSVMTVNEAAEFLRVSRRTVDRLLRSGELTATPVGSRKRIRRADLDRYLDDRSARAGARTTPF